MVFEGTFYCFNARADEFKMKDISKVVVDSNVSNLK